MSSNRDIRLQISFYRHVKRRKLQTRLGPEGVLALIDLLLYAGENKPDGSLSGMTEEDIGLAAQWTGDPKILVSALLEIGFLDNAPSINEQCSSINRTGPEYSIHDWFDHNSYAFHAPIRSEKARKAAAARWGKQGVTCSEHKRAMPQASNSNAPSPTPTPIKKDMSESDFNLFYQTYPIHQSRKKAFDAWKKIKADNGLPEIILAAIEKQKVHKAALKARGEFVSEWPLPATWLNGRRWEDEIPEAKGSW